MRILIWHVHGGWMEAFVRGRHELVLPRTEGGGPWGLGRGGRDWPSTAREVAPELLRDEDIDIVVLQRPEEIDRVEALTGRRPGRDLPAVFVEHNTPKGQVPETVHPLVDADDALLVHVTHFNRLFWESGRARTAVVEHGVPDHGERWTGELPRLAALMNEPVRRGRVTGTDLLPEFAEAGPVDVYGIDADRLAMPGVTGSASLDGEALRSALAQRRAYVHPMRWTSLGLSLLETMTSGMPVLALASTEAIRAVPPEAGALSTDPTALVAHARRLLADHQLAREQGRAARRYALEHYGLQAFHDRWDELLADEVERFAARRRSAVGVKEKGRTP